MACRGVRPGVQPELVRSTAASGIQCFKPALQIGAKAGHKHQRPHLLGRRGGAMAVSYALFFGVLALLAALVVPQLVQSITAFAGRLTAYEETIRQLLLWVQATFGIDMATAEQLVQAVGSELQGWFASLSRQAAQAAARAAGDAAGAAANAFVALAVSIYLLSGKENLLHAAHTCLRAALPPRAAGRYPSVPAEATCSQ